MRGAMTTAMRMMGNQFIAGETISDALKNRREFSARGFLYSCDMLGEAACTAEDAARYYQDDEAAIHAIGQSAGNVGVYAGPGISIKLSALHPRYSRAQKKRVMAELLPRLHALSVLARQYNIGINIDAEESDRLDLSLDLLEALCFDPAFAGWNGIGFVIQAYQKRAPYVIDYVLDLAQRSEHRLMVRLVKGAYWDSEIKRAQVDGLADYPVYTRKVYTDLSYLACAKKLLAEPEWIYPQFATHNAQNVAAIYHLAGHDYCAGQYEFQCLHGMGEKLYEEVTGMDKLARPCRIYAPVGSHQTLQAYLVRRLLENGANSSFVNKIAAPSMPINALIADPVDQAQAVMPLFSSHEKIPLPRALFGTERLNSQGLDLSNENTLIVLAAGLLSSGSQQYKAQPMLGANLPQPLNNETLKPVCNPADHRDVVGFVQTATAQQIQAAFGGAADAQKAWQTTAVGERAACLNRCADLMEAHNAALLGLLVREAGKSLPNAIGEVREAVDFLRYYASQITQSFDNASHIPLGTVVCISPWNDLCCKKWTPFCQ